MTIWIDKSSSTYNDDDAHFKNIYSPWQQIFYIKVYKTGGLKRATNESARDKKYEIMLNDTKCF